MSTFPHKIEIDDRFPDGRFCISGNVSNFERMECFVEIENVLGLVFKMKFAPKLI